MLVLSGIQTLSVFFLISTNKFKFYHSSSGNTGIQRICFIAYIPIKLKLETNVHCECLWLQKVMQLVEPLDQIKITKVDLSNLLMHLSMTILVEQLTSKHFYQLKYIRIGFSASPEAELYSIFQDLSRRSFKTGFWQI